MSAIDLNSDLGEWDLLKDSENDARMFEIITSANVACGFHAGSPDSMVVSARLAAQHGVTLGAHPAYRDRAGFGRREQEVDGDTLRIDVLEQLDALSKAAHTDEAGVRYLKPHGALYNRIAVDPVQANAVAFAAREASLPILGLAGTAIHEATDRLGVQFFREAFVDRAYLPDGRLLPRSSDGAVITDPISAAERAVRMVADRTVQAIDGTILRIELDSLCVHGDTLGALAMAKEVREQLIAAGIEVRAFL